MDKERLLSLTSEIVVAHLGNNKAEPTALPGMIQSVYTALATVGQTPRHAEETPVPAVPIRSSVRPGSIACLECGTRLLLLKRHLGIAHGLTPEQYKARWGLDATYPLVAPEQAQKRTELARRLGLGRKPAADR